MAFKKLIVLVFFLSIGGTVFGQAVKSSTGYPLDRLAAVVGDKIILKSDIDKGYEQLAQENPSLRGDSKLKCNILSQLLTEKLLLIQAALDSIKIDDNGVDQEMARKLNFLMQRNFDGDQAKMEQFLGKSLLEYKEEIRPEMVNQQLAQSMQQKLTEKVNVSPSEVTRYFKGLAPDSVPLLGTEVLVGEIVKYPVFSAAAKQAARDKLNAIRDRVRKGEKFETLALLYSQDPGSASKGGDLGFQSRGTSVKQFEAVAYRLKPGEMSQPVETEFGFHLIEVLERRGEQIHLRHILITPDLGQSDLDSAQSKLDTVYKYLKNKKISFATAASLYSDDDNTKGNAGMISREAVPIDQLGTDQSKPTLFSVVDTLHSGSFSPPLEYVNAQGKKGFRIIYVKTKTQPHKANLGEDYPRIQQFALQSKQKKAFETWVDTKQKTTYIKIDENFQGCENMKTWMKLSNRL